jgi:hypothetical protein
MHGFQFQKDNETVWRDPLRVVGPLLSVPHEEAPKKVFVTAQKKCKHFLVLKALIK